VRVAVHAPAALLRQYHGRSWTDEQERYWHTKCVFGPLKVAPDPDEILAPFVEGDKGESDSSGEEPTEPYYKTRREMRDLCRKRRMFPAHEATQKSVQPSSHRLTEKQCQLLPELKPPSALPRGNVGTPSKELLEKIASCRLPTSALRTLHLNFDVHLSKRRRRYGTMPPPSVLLDEKRHRKVALPRVNASEDEVPALVNSPFDLKNDAQTHVVGDSEHALCESAIESERKSPSQNMDSPQKTNKTWTLPKSKHDATPSSSAFRTVLRKSTDTREQNSVMATKPSEKAIQALGGEQEDCDFEDTTDVQATSAQREYEKEEAAWRRSRISTAMTSLVTRRVNSRPRSKEKRKEPQQQLSKAAQGESSPSVDSTLSKLKEYQRQDLQNKLMSAFSLAGTTQRFQRCVRALSPPVCFVWSHISSHSQGGITVPSR
jgi:hypothetical protein